MKDAKVEKKGEFVLHCMKTKMGGVRWMKQADGHINRCFLVKPIPPCIKNGLHLVLHSSHQELDGDRRMHCEACVQTHPLFCLKKEHGKRGFSRNTFG